MGLVGQREHCSARIDGDEPAHAEPSPGPVRQRGQKPVPPDLHEVVTGRQCGDRRGGRNGRGTHIGARPRYRRVGARGAERDSDRSAGRGVGTGPLTAGIAAARAALSPDRPERPAGQLGATPGVGAIGAGGRRRRLGVCGHLTCALAPGRRRGLVPLLVLFLLCPLRAGTRTGGRRAPGRSRASLERARHSRLGDTTSSRAGGLRHGPLQSLDALEEGDGGVVCLRMGQFDERHLQVHALIGDVTHVDLGAAQLLEGAYQRRKSHPSGDVLHLGALCACQAHELARHDGQEPLTEVLGEVSRQSLRVAARLARVRHRHEGTGPGRAPPGTRPARRAPRCRRRPCRPRRPGRGPTGRPGPIPVPGAPRRRAPRRAAPSLWRIAPGGAAPTRVSEPRRRNSKCWVRLRIVGSTFWASVVASTKTTWPGGSSRVFNNALEAAVESMCTSSTM